MSSMQTSSLIHPLLLLTFLIASCSTEPHCIRLEQGFSAQVEVFTLQYKPGADSASSAKASLRYFDVELVQVKDSSYTTWQEQVSAMPDSGLSDVELVLHTPTFVHGIKAHYAVQQDGSLGELQNWPEIKAYVDSISVQYMALYAPQPLDSTKAQLILDHYNTQNVLENKMFKCTAIFHSPYGLCLDTTDGGGRMGIDFADVQLLSFQKVEDRIAFLCAYPESSTAAGQDFLQPFAGLGLPDSLMHYDANISFTDTLYAEFNREKNHLGYAHFQRSMRMRDEVYLEIIEVRVIR